MIEFNQIKTGKGITNISLDTINSIAKTKLFEEDSDKNDRLYKLHQKLLRYSMLKNGSKEVGILWNIETDESILVVGTEDGVNLVNNKEASEWLKRGFVNSLVFMHNHPRNGLFSFKDIQSFLNYSTILAMTAVCNDGRIHVLRKECGFNADYALTTYTNAREKGKSGITELTEKSSSLCLMYRCSVPRKVGKK